MIIKIMNTKTVIKTYNLGDPRREIKIDNLVKRFQNNYNKKIYIYKRKPSKITS